MRYKDARKALDRSRTSRGFYPNRRPDDRRSEATSQPVCFRCGKPGHRARQCQQKISPNQGAPGGRVGFVGMVLAEETIEKDNMTNTGIPETTGSAHSINNCIEILGALAGYPVPGPEEVPVPVFTAARSSGDDVFVGAVMNQHSHRHAVLDCGASESIVGVTVLQDYGDELQKLAIRTQKSALIDLTKGTSSLEMASHLALWVLPK